jgi:DNA-directed RNA polymerase subunit RPC12/RpoP
MSFRCADCGKQQKRGSKVVKRVTAIRKVVYMRGEGERRRVIAEGKEIVEEVSLCPSCSSRRPSPWIVKEEKVVYC